MDDINQQIVKLLSLGMTQKDVSNHLKEKGVTPCSLSIIEKRLKLMKKEYKAKTLFHLAIILKKKKII
ncbi:hypothetical protein CXF68_17725 [Tenacibaculum sp. Bg11-29]|uniref:hypothetical protein n=1 Tax=Tenacibaculum sp. Bg11-29 TaxID=2058306 RepID=UPI000C325357|nr:hypothetical protein [Tenacibaculum sp. Bg11-29]PKH52418.1 hypothetical protein CXF68_17725 [Tenacibaculum sp. Bg11-29]